MKYHSALSNELELLEETLLYQNSSGVAFKYDVTEKYIPKHFDKCDVFYSEISWTAGIQKFNERAGIVNSYMAYIDGIKKFIEQYPDKQIYIVAGKNENKVLPSGHRMIPTKLNGAPAIIYAYNLSEGEHRDYLTSRQIMNNCEHLIKELAIFYDVIGDFCCGYGRTGNIFSDAGKQFVMSDYNGKCITYIKNHYENIQ